MCGPREHEHRKDRVRETNLGGVPKGVLQSDVFVLQLNFAVRQP